MGTKAKLTFLFAMLYISASAQIGSYAYKREISGIKDSWHKVVLPVEIFEKISADFSDIRIYGITAQNDTVEAPYILQTTSEKLISEKLKTGIINNPKNKKTFIDADLTKAAPISQLRIYVKDKYDYYRHVTVEYLSDSVKTHKGWKYNYTELTTAALNSIDKDDILFNSTILKKLRIIIENNDNEPLNIDSITVKGYEYELIIRFNTPAAYYLTYGNKSASAPVYDISNFTSKIPENMTTLTLGEEQMVAIEAPQNVSPLFQNKLWLWVVMSVIILVLGVFSYRMIAKR